MQIKYDGMVVECRQINTYATRLRINDFLVGPNGMLLKVVTVQPHCPMWETNRRQFTAVLVQTEDGRTIHLREFPDSVSVLRPRRSSLKAA